MKKWQLFPKITSEFYQQHPDIPSVLLQLLFNRNLKKTEEIQAFLVNSLDHKLTLSIGDNSNLNFYDPFLFQDMNRAVDLIIDHIKKGNLIVVYGDYDADGVTSSVILLEALKILQAKTEVYLPDRISEGYGLNRTAIDQIVDQGGKLIITVDNGIRNREEVDYAQSRRVDVIITDHHILPEEAQDLPSCPIINPANRQDNYPWPYLAGVGVAFKLITALLSKASLDDKQKRLILEKSLDLVAVGTIADLVSLLGENRLLVQAGLKILNHNRRLGLNELIKLSKINGNRPLEAWNVGWQIGPRLNAASRLSHANSAFALLTTTDPEEAKALANELNQRNISRQQITEEMIVQVEEQIDPQNLPSVIIGLAGEDQFWNEGVIGLVAGKISERYYRPTFIITRLIEEAEFDANSKKLVPKKVSFKGSGRSIEEFNMIAAVEDCSEYLEKYGGHPMACGFSISSQENLDKFREKIMILASHDLANQDLNPKIKIEAELKLDEINLELVEQVNQLAPYGQNNSQPNFVSYNLRINDIVTMGFNNQHLKIRLSQTEKSFWALAFSAAETYRELRVGDQIDLVYYLDINDYNGRREVQLKIIDLKFHQSE